MQPKPFLKWVGGKTQLLRQMSHFFPSELKHDTIKTYIEPFVGGGAVFLYLANTYNIENFIISDINPELVIAYKTIQRDVEDLILRLEQIENKYLSLQSTEREKYFYQVRWQFNWLRNQIDLQNYNLEWIERTAQMIFLNRTCFNGLFRVNSTGDFNVPIGRYSRPKICNAENLRSVAQVLQKTHVYQGDFSTCTKFINNNTFVYLDPPYKPISKTSNFTSYSQHIFDDREQLRLRDFFKLLDTKDVKLLLSNSDITNQDSKDNFFENAYSDYRIERVKANRNINSDTSKRKSINEILIMNY
ncbi:MAG: DNA adenine methylase [Calothrix sp. MO_192.B10]|nr:DNA adenine methylase [Calothrix sp. MO_192.B10]